MLINISGYSGVGKTTIAKILYFVLAEQNKSVLHLCGDDLHKWERTDNRWKEYTHLNPAANNIDLGVQHTQDLVNGKSIKRKSYNHNTGKFDGPSEVTAPDILINEGLHALYDDETCKLADLNIFVDTDDELKKKWKIKRDIEQRGYTEKQVLDAIERRKSDEKKYISPQKQSADVVLSFFEKNNNIVLRSTCLTNPIVNKIISFYKQHKQFLSVCDKCSREYELIQGSGGNISYKIFNKTIITASGYTVSDVSMFKGFSLCYSDNTIIDDNQLRPSMETPLHNLIKSNSIVHTHPIYLNTILCSKQSKQLASKLIGLSYNIDYINYVTPGDDLAKAFKATEKILLLENHGLFVSDSNIEKAFEISMDINLLCKKWLESKCDKLPPLNNSFHNYHCKNYLYPDAAVLPAEHSHLNSYMVHIQQKTGLSPNFLSDEEVDKLRSMDAEKYRKALR